MYFTLSEIDWLPEIFRDYYITNPKYFEYVNVKAHFRSIRKKYFPSEVYLHKYYTNPIIIFGVDIVSLVNKGYHYLKTSTFSCHM